LNEGQPIGFVAMWKSTDTWFNASEEEKKEFMRKLDDAFERARKAGIKMYGTYDCCWSTEWRYFSFWEAPDIETLEKVMKELCEIGDINMYHSQRHFVGRKVE
jgi:predicted peroxiredoxin